MDSEEGPRGPDVHQVHAKSTAGDEHINSSGLTVLYLPRLVM